MDYIGKLAFSLLDGLKYTVGLFGVTIVFSLPLGLLFSFGRASDKKTLWGYLSRGFLSFYVWLFRGTPLLLQLFFFCYGITVIPGIGQYLVMDRFVVACVTFVLNYTAYFCEIFRGGLKSIDKGQYEAARILGLKRRHTVFRVVIPQMLRVCLPPVSNECITLVKDTALITAIGITELLYFARSAVNRDVNPIAFAVVAVFYLVMTYGLTYLFRRLEKRYSY